MCIKQIEEISMNALPALQTIVYDGWILRFANGYSRRANSVNPLYSGDGNPDEKIAACEALFRARNQKVTFKLTPNVCPADLDERLHSKGYAKDGGASVQVADLAELPQPSRTAQIKESLTPQWLDEYCRMNQVEDRHRHTLTQILPNIHGKTAFTSLVQNGQTVACGLGVLEGEHVGLFDITTDPAWRKQGLGEALVLSVMAWARENGARTAYLQVVTNNTPALRLYEKLGFKEVYQYWYRTKP